MKLNRATVMAGMTGVEVQALKALAKRWWPKERGGDCICLAAEVVLQHGLADVDSITRRHTEFSRYCRAEGLERDDKAQSVVMADRVRAAFARSTELQPLKGGAR